MKIVAASFLICFASISLVPEKDLRYGLLILPSGLLLAGVGIEELLKKYIRKTKAVAAGCWVAWALTLVCFLLLFPRVIQYLEHDAHQFVGFREAGEMIKEKNKPHALILASSPRLVRYYSGINLREFGGQVHAFPKSKAEFAQIVAAAQIPLILEIDLWERTQPEWCLAMTKDGFQFLQSLGFKTEGVVARQTADKDGFAAKAVVWVFSRE